MRKYKKRFYQLLTGLILLSGCANNDIIKHPETANKYNPSIPQQITGFTPTEGEINDKIIIEGNFASDTSKVKVFFAETKEAKIISSDGASIYCLVPKQPDGANSIKVVIDGKEIIAEQKFNYHQSQKVSTICGTYQKWGYQDGTLSEALFNDVIGITTVADDNIVAVETHAKRLRLISQADNQVVTILSGLCTGKPAVTSERDTLYAVELYRNTGKIYRLARANNWGAELLRGNIEELKDGEQWACALDKTDNYLYIRNNVGVFVRVNLKEKDENGNLKVEKLLEESNYMGGDTYNFLVYSRVENCFYATEITGQAILKIYQQPNGNWIQEVYAGALHNPGNTDGDRLDAKFHTCGGLTVDSEGNLYVTNIGNNSIRKIAYPSGYVTTIAGGSASDEVETDGLPLEATFKDLRDIAVDSEDNFYIAGGSSYNIRKLAIE